jgi:hypothetical protein
MLLLFFILLSFTIFVYNQTYRKRWERFQSPMKNIYGEVLKPCRKFKSDMSGSWDDKGYCSELGGGVHQICFDVNKQTQDFAKDTYQGVNWSKDRVGKNHCMCLGAWALYKARQSKKQIQQSRNELNCHAIPEVSLSSQYVSTWNSWNGNELPNQIVQGVNELVSQCYKKGNQKQKKHLKQTYYKLAKAHNAFQKSTLPLP